MVYVFMAQKWEYNSNTLTKTLKEETVVTSETKARAYHQEKRAPTKEGYRVLDKAEPSWKELWQAQEHQKGQGMSIARCDITFAVANYLALHEAQNVRLARRSS